MERECFRPEDVWINGRLIPGGFIEKSFRERRGISATERVRWVAEVIEHHLWIQYHCGITPKQRADLKASLNKMHRKTSLRSAYKQFFSWMGKPELFKPARNGTLEYSDVFPLIYLKIRIMGIKSAHQDIKHLVIDEMQDYTPLQYAVIARMFPCEKTILGDISQSVNSFSSSNAETIQGIFRQADCVKLCKSYRSSYEITQFEQHISPNADLIAIERHGDQPLVLTCTNKTEETERILQSIREFLKSGYRTMGIICKTQKYAEQLQDTVQNEGLAVHLLTPGSTSFVQGVVICTAYLAKGLEFDMVHVPDSTNSNYATEMDRRMLYVACTRAMHQLTLTCVGTGTKFIPQELFRQVRDTVMTRAC